ncbi:MAG: hypothetical protein J6M41_04365 [Prevotella sp.]|nr:hypothetical protein [Prevotella sp.]
MSRVQSQACLSYAEVKPSEVDGRGWRRDIDTDAAISEAVYALDTLKADGIKLAT